MPHPVYRDDNELIGFLHGADDAWVPTTVFGYPLAEATDRASAEDTLHSVGMSYLAERWLMRSGDEWLRAEIVEAGPDRVTVQLVDFGQADRYGERHVLTPPVHGSLRLA